MAVRSNSLNRDCTSLAVPPVGATTVAMIRLDGRDGVGGEGVRWAPLMVVREGGGTREKKQLEN